MRFSFRRNRKKGEGKAQIHSSYASYKDYQRRRKQYLEKVEPAFKDIDLEFKRVEETSRITRRNYYKWKPVVDKMVDPQWDDLVNPANREQWVTSRQEVEKCVEGEERIMKHLEALLVNWGAHIRRRGLILHRMKQHVQWDYLTNPWSLEPTAGELGYEVLDGEGIEETMDKNEQSGDSMSTDEFDKKKGKKAGEAVYGGMGHDDNDDDDDDDDDGMRVSPVAGAYFEHPPGHSEDGNSKERETVDPFSPESEIDDPCFWGEPTEETELLADLNIGPEGNFLLSLLDD